MRELGQEMDAEEDVDVEALELDALKAKSGSSLHVGDSLLLFALSTLVTLLAVARSAASAS